MTAGDQSPDDEAPGDATRSDVAPDEQARGDDRDRWLVRTGVIVAATVAVAVVAAVALGALGASGAGAAIGLLLVMSLGCGVAALVALASAAVDEFRGRPVPLGRPLLGVVLLAASVAFTIMAVAAG